MCSEQTLAYLFYDSDGLTQIRYKHLQQIRSRPIHDHYETKMYEPQQIRTIRDNNPRFWYKGLQAEANSSVSQLKWTHATSNPKLINTSSIQKFTNRTKLACFTIKLIYAISIKGLQ